MPIPLLRLLCATALVAPALLPSSATAQRRDRDLDGYRSRIDTTFAFERDGLVDVEQIAGDVTITTWDRPEIRIRAYAEHGRLISSFSRSRVQLRVEGEEQGRGRRRIGESAYELTMPVGVRVKAASVSGDVDVSGTRSEVEAASVSGDVDVRDVAGLVAVSSVSGDVAVHAVRGDLTVRTVSGDLDARDIVGDVRAGTVSGDIQLRALTSRTVTAKSTSGEIEFQGPLERSGRYEFNSHSGNVRLVLPTDTGAEISIETFSGSLDTEFEVTLGAGTSRRRPRTLEFTLGDGRARVTAQTFSGNVVLERGSRPERE